MEKKRTKSKKWILPLFILTILSINLVLVSAVEWNDVVNAEGFSHVSTFFNWLTEPLSPIGFEDSAVGVTLGIIALIMIFVIMLDVFGLLLPFSNWVNYILAVGFAIAMSMLGIVRTAAGWGLTIGAYITGGAGALAIIFSAVLFAVGIIVLFWGNQKLAKWVARAKGNREIIEAEREAYKEAADLRKGEVKLKVVGQKI